jgi:hypothetical protein
MLSVIKLNVIFAECRNEVHYVEYHYAECHYAECHYIEYRGAMSCMHAISYPVLHRLHG